MTIFRDHDGANWTWHNGDESDDLSMPTDLLTYLLDMQELLEEELPHGLLVFTEHKRGGHIFRSSPKFRDILGWHDWVLLDWGRGHGKLPAHIWAFVDFSELPDNFRRKFQGSYIQKGVFAVTESAKYLPNDTGCQMLRPLQKEIVVPDGEACFQRKFWLSDVEGFVSPLCVVPDINSVDIFRYFEVQPQRDWHKVFLDWLEAPTIEDDMNEMKLEEGWEQYNAPPVLPKAMKIPAQGKNKRAKRKA
jgi:hypothetical protein